ncbi:MAG: biotin/lipoyl-containing protein [Pseudomonas fluorescens]
MRAMKMETMLSAEHDATVHAIHVRTGETVNAQDLLVELS